MKRTIWGVLALCVGLAGPAWAAPAIILEGTCGVLDASGREQVLGALRLLMTRDGSGAATWRCEARQNPPPGYSVRWNFRNTGQTCGVGDGERSDRWQETISATGRIVLTCTVP